MRFTSAASTFLLGAVVVSNKVASAQRTCNDTLCKALSAALAEIVDTNNQGTPTNQDYLDTLDDFFLSDPLFYPRSRANDCDNDANGYKYPYPTTGTMLDNVLKAKKIRVIWSPAATPFSLKDSVTNDPTGLSVELWPLLVDRLAFQYNVPDLDFELIESPVGINDQYLFLANPSDPDCTSRAAQNGFETADFAELCSDVIGGGYAVNGPRSATNDFTCTYMPLSLNAVRTNVPLPSAYDNIVIDMQTSLVDQLRAIVSVDNPLVIAVIANSAEVNFVNGRFAKEGGGGLLDGLTMVTRDGAENIYEYADRQTNEPAGTAAHFVFGQIARLTYFRDPSIVDPLVCANCQIGLMANIEGTAFGTAKDTDDGIGECESIECTIGSDCAGSLRCAADAQADLIAAGLDGLKAYCGQIGNGNWALCFDEDKALNGRIGLGECQQACNLDSDCDAGLECANKHKQELRDANLDADKAYCPLLGPLNSDVCYDPAIAYGSSSSASSD